MFEIKNIWREEVEELKMGGRGASGSRSNAGAIGTKKTIRSRKFRTETYARKNYLGEKYI